jgi:hypothetical protein
MCGLQQEQQQQQSSAMAKSLFRRKEMKEERKPQRRQRKHNTPQRTATQRERETEEQPALVFSVDRGHPSSALFIRPFFQKYIQSPQSSSLIPTLHPYFLPEEHLLASEFIHPFQKKKIQSPQSSSYTRTLHPSFILNEHQSPPRGILLTEFIHHPYSSTILPRRTSVDYSQYTVTKVHPSSARFIHPAEEDQWPSSSSCICTLHSILSSE